MTGDRSVHAKGAVEATHPVALNVGAEIVEVVRYDRGGKWYVEGPIVGRRQLTFASAVEMATTIARNGGQLFFGQQGGRAFDRRLADYRPVPPEVLAP